MISQNDLCKFINVKLLGENPNEQLSPNFLRVLGNIVSMNRDVVNENFITVTYSNDTVFNLLRNNIDYIHKELKELSSKQDKCNYILKFIRKNIYYEYKKGI